MSSPTSRAAMSEAEVELTIELHRLMKDYTSDRIETPYKEDETTTIYLRKVIDLLDAAISLAAHPEPLQDTMLLVKCFGATALLSSHRSLQILMFLDWVHQVQNDLLVIEGKRETIQPPINPADSEFWNHLSELLLVGKLKAAADLLKNCEAAEDEDFAYAGQLVESYPLEASKYSVFMHWRQNSLTWSHNLQHKQGVRYQSELRVIANILIGDTQTILRAATDWISSVSGLFLFSDPSPDALGSHFSMSIAVHNVNEIQTWEEGCKALFEDKVISALGCLELLNVGCAVVISEFCNERGLLHKYSSRGEKAGGGVREHLALEFIAACLKEPQLVGIGTDVLVNVGNDSAKEAAQNLLPGLVELSSDYADIAVETANQLGLNDLEVELCQIAAAADAKASKYLRAMKLFHRASNYKALKNTAWSLFEELIVSKRAPADEETTYVLQEKSGVDALDLPAAIKDSIAPSAVLLALFESIDSEDVEEIVLNLKALLAFPDPPLEYYPLLVASVITISGSVLTLNNMTMLMSALNLWEDAAEPIKARSFELIMRASHEVSWRPTLDPELKPNSFAWLLKRQLAKEVFL